MPKVSAENPKLFKFKKQIQATNCSSGHVEGSFENFLKFFGQKSDKFFAQNPKKKYEKKNKKIFSSGVFILDTKIEVWKPCQRVLQKIQNDSKL